ncbi:MAG: 30S ribosomal protein S12 methylthiotransferase RimO [Acidobacteriota bacterium]
MSDHDDGRPATAQRTDAERDLELGGPRRVGLVSLGCPKNRVDAELMLARLRAEGHELVDDPQQADAIIVNTCAFIDEAKEESIEAILEASQWLEGREDGKLVVTGCLAQRHAPDIADDLPEVSAFVPLGEVGLVPKAVTGTAPRIPELPERYGATFLDDATAARVLTSAPGSAYLKISEGCDHQCSFCAIPAMRGRHRSRPVDDLVAEATTLAGQGVREVVLVAQDSSAYGHDRQEREGLSRLLTGLDGVDGLDWVRVMYAYPNTLSEKTLRAMAELPSVCRYLDMPLQHASRRVLKDMARGGSRDHLRRQLERARELVPGLVLRTTFIVGFPGETEDDVAELIGFIEEVEFDHLGVFTYSQQDGTTAHPLGDTVSEEEKAARRDAVMEAQAPISKRLNEARVGQELEVLVEGVHPESEHLLVGRWWGQAPDVDGTVILTDGHAEPGTLARVLIEEAHEYDLVGRIVGPAADAPEGS